VTDRASFMAAVASTPRGHDPGLPDRAAAPDAPTELRAGESPLDRFQTEAEAVSTIVERVDAAGAASAVAAALEAAGAGAVAIAADLGDLLEPVREACRSAGLQVDDYADVAPERARAAALDATVTGCLAAVAATGSIVTTGATGRAAALIAPTHVCVVRADQVVDGLHALVDGDVLAAAGSMFALQSGPSRSADIEKTLILGVHGPGRVHVLLVV